MAIDFFDATSTSIKMGQLAKNRDVAKKLPGDITTSKDVSGIEIRMLPPLIIDNHTNPVWPFPGYSKLYCLTIVVSDVENQVVGSIDLKGFPRIGDQEHLPINKTIFYWQSSAENKKAPNQIHIMTSVIKSKQALRDVSKILTEVKNDENYKNIIQRIGKTAADASAAGMVIDMIGEVATLVGKYLGKVEDKPIGTTINSYTTLYGDFDVLGINKRKIPTPDVVFEFDLVVRDKTQKKSASGTSRTRGGGKAAAEDEDDEVIVEMTQLN
jgi:hypothetical protein